jgi:uncharacterized protein YndB with AHSA1/START domain
MTSCTATRELAGETMAADIGHMTSFAYTTYIHAAPEQVWHGLTAPAFTKR